MLKALREKQIAAIRQEQREKEQQRRQAVMQTMTSEQKEFWSGYWQERDATTISAEEYSLRRVDEDMKEIGKTVGVAAGVVACLCTPPIGWLVGALWLAKEYFPR